MKQATQQVDLLSGEPNLSRDRSLSPGTIILLHVRWNQEANSKAVSLVQHAH